jgi:hypothetical protein
MTTLNLNTILSPGIRAKNLLLYNSRYIDFNKIDNDNLGNYISSHFTVSEKIQLIYNLYNDKLIKVINKIEFSDSELLSINNVQYQAIIDINPKLFRKSVIDLMPSSSKYRLFSRYPSLFIENKCNLPEKISNRWLNVIAMTDAKLVEQNITDFSKISVTSTFWCSLISYDKKYEDIFLENMHTCSTKTELRNIFYTHPTLLKKLTANHLGNNKLTFKEMSLLLSTIISKNSAKNKPLYNWKLPDDIVDFLKFQIAYEILDGTSKKTNRLKGALKSI